MLSIITALLCIQIDGATYSNANWTNIAIGASFSEDCIVHIPDANFKAYLLANASINTTDDGEISYIGSRSVYRNYGLQ